MAYSPNMQNKLKLLYNDKADDILRELNKRFSNAGSEIRSDLSTVNTTNGHKRLSEKDAILITYGDCVTSPDKTPLCALAHFLNDFGQDVFSGVHILPFYPYSSDDGFSVIDYTTVNPDLGNWKDIEGLSGSYDLMLDAVVNHISSKSHWFKSYLSGDASFQNFFIEADPDLDYTPVVRPRTLPLLTEFDTSQGKKWLWTTFSDDQIDLNFSNPQVLLKILDILVFYAEKRARYIRLDAIGFIWKKMGTTCMHLPETHAIIQIMRQVLDHTHPGTHLITETNVPHQDNISYFGDGEAEAHMVYQFPLPPLVLHSFSTGQATTLMSWLRSLSPPPPGCFFFNFLASHDGIGIRPVEGMLSDDEISSLVSRTLEHGGQVSYKTDSNGSKSPYELNISYRDALSKPGSDLKQRADIMIAAHSVLFAIQGIPAVYFSSFFGAGNDEKGYRDSGIKRRINRKKYDQDELKSRLTDKGSLNFRIWSSLVHLMTIRKNTPCFSPGSDQSVPDIHPGLFAVLRSSKNETLLCITNVSDQTVNLNHPVMGYDLLTKHDTEKKQITPYEVLWLQQEDH